MITKGALDKVLEACTTILEEGKAVPLDEKHQEALQAKFADWSEQGFRVLGVATKEVAPQENYPVEEESKMTFIGFLLFFDPPKPDAQKGDRGSEKTGGDPEGDHRRQPPGRLACGPGYRDAG